MSMPAPALPAAPETAPVVAPPVASPPRRRSWSIRARLMAWLIAPLSLVALLVAAETFLSARKVAETLHDRTLLAVMLAISEDVTSGEGDLLAEDVLEVLTEGLGDQFFYHYAGPGNAFVTGYGDPPRPAEAGGLEGGRPHFYRGMHGGDPVRAVALRQLVSDRELSGWTTITVWQRVSERRALAWGLFARSLARIALVLAVTGLIVWIAVRRALEPLNDLRRAIAQRSPGDLSPLRRPVPLELREVVETVNALFARLTRSNDARERLVGDAAHQLKNPVAAVRAQAETALAARTPDEMRRRLEGVAASTRDLSRLVVQLLSSARIHGGVGMGRAELRMGALVRDAVLSLTDKALDRDQTIELVAEDTDGPVTADPVVLREAIVNLVDNAIVHNPPGTRIGVDVRTAAGEVLVTVRDDGPGLPPGDVDDLVEPFVSGSRGSASGGSGLGLSIARDVAQAHGGTLRLARRPGGGTEAGFSVRGVR